MTQKINNIRIISHKDCCGCAACLDICPKNAISMTANNKGGEIFPFVDNNKCINCGKCIKTCQGYNFGYDKLLKKEAFVGTYDSKESFLSSSGGIFLLLAKYILIQGGVVYGAALVYEDDSVRCKHIRIDNIDYLYKLQGSKYVQSRTDGIFNQVKQDLKYGKTVLFSGTSCQVASLQQFVGAINTNLFTIDLICHGVPQNSVFQDYIHYIEKKQKCKITDVSFRKKGMVFNGHPTSYYLTITAISSQGEPKQFGYFVPESPFYSLFINRCGYREVCYYCKYASLNKPSDITLGDFVPTDYDINQYHLNSNKAWSSIIINRPKGYDLFNKVRNDLKLIQIPLNLMVEHHGNLQSPSIKNAYGKLLYYAYQIGGYPILDKMLYLFRKRKRN